MLKVVSSVSTATGEYGKLLCEVTKDGEKFTVNIKEKVGGSIVGGGTYTPKYLFNDVEAMLNLKSALDDALNFVGAEAQ